MFVKYQQDQQFLLPPSLSDMIPSDHLARLINDVVDMLDIGSILMHYREDGRPAYHPRMLLKIIIYGYTSGIRSSRKLAKALETDIAFMWLGACTKPDFRTIALFRKRHLNDLKEIFVQLGVMLIKEGYASLGTIALDGTKIKAMASKRSIKNKEDLLALEKKLEEAIDVVLKEAIQADEAEDDLFGEKRGDELPEALKDPVKRKAKIQEALNRAQGKKVVISEPDASLVKEGGTVKPGYNCQAAVSEEGFIIACDVVQKPTDNHQAKPMLEKTAKIAGCYPERALFDAGYNSYQTYSFIDEAPIDIYMPVAENLGLRRQQKKSVSSYAKEYFTYLPDEDCYLCPEKTKLLREGTVPRKDGTYAVVYRCKNMQCPQKKLCTTNKKGRTIKRRPHEDIAHAMKQKMQTDEAKVIYRKRQAIVEPVFSLIKRMLGYTRFLLRGIDNVQGEWHLICIAVNLFKLWRRHQMALVKT